ncbi:MAG: ATP-binding protein [Candidatus Ranarchaeia archaeon]
MAILIGNVMGAEFPDKIYIARKEGAEIWLGDILKIRDIEDQEQEYLIRVSGAIQPTTSDSEMLSRRILSDQMFSQIAQTRGSRDIYIAVLLCSFKVTPTLQKKPYIPKKLPGRFSNVYLPEKDDFMFIDDLQNKGYDLPIGTLRVRGDYQPIIRIKGDDLPRHVGVYAITGKGKTGFTKVLIYQIAMNSERKYAALVFDAHDEYYATLDPSLRGLKDAPVDNLHYFNLHDIKSPKISLSSILPGDFKMIYQEAMSSAQNEAIQVLYNHYREEWLTKLITVNDEELKLLEQETSAKLPTLKVLKRRAHLLEEQAIFERGGKLDLIKNISSLLEQGNVCIVNTRNLTGTEERALLSVLTRKLLDERKRLLDKPSGSKLLAQKPVLLIVLEEALGVLGQSVLRRGSNIFAELTREGRKYKIGLLPVVQIPHRLDPDVASNINTNVILGLAQSRSRISVADNSMDDMDPLIDEMKMLDIGEALISYPHKGEVPFPLPVKITYFNDLLDEANRKRPPKKRVSPHLT